MSLDKVNNKAHQKIRDQAVAIESYITGPTWNDGGSYHTWVYEMIDGTYMKVHQPTDYRSEIQVKQVYKVERTIVEYKETAPELR